MQFRAILLLLALEKYAYTIDFNKILLKLTEYDKKCFIQSKSETFNLSWKKFIFLWR